ncbi:hypothetical protein SO802_010707 [Lithocarpus litseifolius]|uniref:Reverse transcriptase zinc-binding domain-containing protein n=1 Tax=Lithocarpus litseifolius TaxID=425828 RepID=A0AAW2DJ52_9ROSI
MKSINSSKDKELKREEPGVIEKRAEQSALLAQPFLTGNGPHSDIKPTVKLENPLDPKLLKSTWVRRARNTKESPRETIMIEAENRREPTQTEDLRTSKRQAVCNDEALDLTPTMVLCLAKHPYKAREVVKRDSIWHIGDGRQVRIHGDKWLHDKFSSRVISPQKNLPNNAPVCAIINEDGPCWDKGRVLSEFFPHEARAILGIPLSSRQVPDTLIWAGTKSGKYTTKSAYKLLSGTPIAGPLNPLAHSGIWKQIWELEVPNKIKHFIWRACCESLTTKKNLFTKEVTRNATCDLCHDGVEDVIHAPWGYQDLQMAGIGAVIRNSSGQFIGALSDRSNLLSAMDDVEAIACRKAISFALELGVDEVEFEEDARALALNFVSFCFSHLRSAIDLERHYKKGDSKSKTLPMYLQVGKVIESAPNFFTGRLTKKERKGTIASEPSYPLLTTGEICYYIENHMNHVMT